MTEDPEVATWHDKLALRSTLTADEYVRVLDRYVQAVDTTPAAIVAKAKDQDGGRRAVEQQLQAFVIAMRKAHKPSSHGENEWRASCSPNHSTSRASVPASAASCARRLFSVSHARLAFRSTCRGSKAVTGFDPKNSAS